jgi:hypothetical protein
LVIAPESTRSACPFALAVESVADAGVEVLGVTIALDGVLLGVIASLAAAAEPALDEPPQPAANASPVSTSAALEILLADVMSDPFVVIGRWVARSGGIRRTSRIDCSDELQPSHERPGAAGRIGELTPDRARFRADVESERDVGCFKR